MAPLVATALLAAGLAAVHLPAEREPLLGVRGRGGPLHGILVLA